MDIFLSILILALLLGLSILLLHRHQQRQAREMLERSDPLQAPELDFSTSAPDSTRPQAEPETVPASGGSSTSLPWQEQVKQLRNEARYEAALALCEAQFPRALAFRQAMVTLRAEIRQQEQQQADTSPALGRLYRVAVLADLFRAGAPGKSAAKRKRDKLMTLALHNLNINYSQIGYRRLKLLSKTDIRQLVALWGEPLRHCHAEISVGADWQDQLQLFSQ